MIKDTWLLSAIFVASASFALWAERKTKIGAKLSGIIIALLMGMILVNIGLIPGWSGAHSSVFSYILPIAIPLLLFQADFRKVFKLGPKLLGAFGIAIIGTIAGAFVAAFAFNIGPETWKVYGMFTGTYIGGSVNLAAIGSGLNIDSSIWTAANAADIIVFFFWMMFLFNAGKWVFLKKLYPQFSESDITEIDKAPVQKDKTIGVVEISIVLGAAVAAAGIGTWIGGLVGVPGVIFSTTIALILAVTTNISKIKLSEDLGIFLVTIFFVVIGALAIFKDVIGAGPKLLGGASTIIIISGLIVFIGGRLFKIPLEFLLLSSNAAIGGPTSAAPMATIYGWRSLVFPGILLGILGYALGTYLGFSVAYILKSLIL